MTIDTKETYSEYLTRVEREIANGERKQLPMTQAVWTEIIKRRTSDQSGATQ